MGLVIAFYAIITAFTITQYVPRERRSGTHLCQAVSASVAKGIFDTTGGVFSVISDLTFASDTHLVDLETAK